MVDGTGGGRSSHFLFLLKYGSRRGRLKLIDDKHEQTQLIIVEMRSIRAEESSCLMLIRMNFVLHGLIMAIDSSRFLFSDVRQS